MGLFVVFEGVEGSGKSTQSKALRRRLIGGRYPVTLVREPGGTPTGEHIRRHLKGADHITPLAELFLFSAARTSLVEGVIRLALDRGEVVVCDRYAYSTLAYQGHARGLDIEMVRHINEIATGGLVPQLIVLLDLDPELGMTRKASDQLDRFESEQTDFHRRVRHGFLELAREEPERWLVLDSSASLGSISDLVWKRVEQMLDGAYVASLATGLGRRS